MRKSSVLTCVTWLILASASTASAGEIHEVLARKDFAAETSTRMMVVMAASSDEPSLAQCMHDRYFGSPLLLRRTLWKVWSDPSANFEQALLAATKTACSKNSPGVTDSERQTWFRTGNEPILLEPGQPAIEQAADMIAAYESMRGSHASEQCAREKANRAQADRLIRDSISKEPRLPVTLAAYDAYRTLCSLNPNGPTAGNIVLPPMPDVPTVARERLMIMQDFAICQSSGKAKEDACIEQAYQTRSKRLFNQLLSSDSRH